MVASSVQQKSRGRSFVLKFIVETLTQCFIRDRILSHKASVWRSTGSRCFFMTARALLTSTFLCASKFIHSTKTNALQSTCTNYSFSINVRSLLLRSADICGNSKTIAQNFWQLTSVPTEGPPPPPADQPSIVISKKRFCFPPNCIAFINDVFS